ncbi:hypothetical protein PAHAL_6G021600 [Panicum hallii]|uniref:F-box associated domain-containing protein n=1 Tax=Panicum hallii TaxID=206008 RepID=A0A2T8IEV4_9POAL|nr:hypothetical protein PAHAL_6G021600 [Panicum hallii]
MNFRRFLYMVENDGVDRSYSLRRIDTSRFFFRASTEGTPTHSTATGLELLFRRRYETAVAFLHSAGTINFALFKNKGNNGGHDMVVAVDNAGRSFICNPVLPPSVHALPSLSSPKFAPFSLTVGDSLYVMDAVPKPPNGCGPHNVELLSNDDDHGWRWSPLDSPPHVYDCPGYLCPRIDSYAVVAGAGIAVSNNDSAQTFRFDTGDKTWSKAGDWVLPFTRLAEYVPEHKLWFGISPIGDGHRFCAANLVASPDSDQMRPPVVHGLWKEYAEPPPEWSVAEAYAVHLGSSRFCIVGLFSTGEIRVETHHSYKVEEELQAVVTSVEVQRCGAELRVVKHKSERYELAAEGDYRILC